MKRASLFVGIDPAFRTGKAFAVVFLERILPSITKFNMEFRTFESFLDFQDFLNSDDAPQINGTVVNIENSNGQKIIFKKGIPYAVSVGKNMAISQLTVDFCIRKGYETNSITPREKGAKITSQKDFLQKLKNDGVECKRHKEINQDIRDAYVLARYNTYYK